MTPSSRYISALRISFNGHAAICLSSAGSGAAPTAVSPKHWRLLEAFAANALTPDEAYSALRLRPSDQQKGLVALYFSERVATSRLRGKTFSLFFENGAVKLVEDSGGAPVLDVTALFALRTHEVFPFLLNSRTPPSLPTRSQFNALFGELRAKGWIAPAVGGVDWGHLRNHEPLCGRFGAGRGTPVDRYYLDQFIARIRPLVSGSVLDIGGEPSFRNAYGFRRVAEHHILQLPSTPGADYTGDAHDASLVPAARYDVILAFNVLEHCERPWQIAANMRRWLKRGGRAICLSPCAQRLHRFPKDYWRLLPDGLESLFSEYASRKVFVYGNPTTVVAAQLGIAREELSAGELRRAHPDYPVVAAIIARK